MSVSKKMLRENETRTELGGSFIKLFGSIHCMKPDEVIIGSEPSGHTVEPLEQKGFNRTNPLVCFQISHLHIKLVFFVFFFSEKTPNIYFYSTL